MNGVRLERIALVFVLEFTKESFKYTLYTVISGLRGLGKIPGSHIMVAILEVITSDLTFLGGLGITIVCKTQEHYTKLCVYVCTCV